MFSLASIIDLASSEGCLWRLVDRLSFKFGFPNWIQTQENILKSRIVLTDLVVGSYELFTSGYVVFRQLENTVLIIKKEYKMKINLPSRRFLLQIWKPPERFETSCVKALFFLSLFIDDRCILKKYKVKRSQKLVPLDLQLFLLLDRSFVNLILNLATPPKSLHQIWITPNDQLPTVSFLSTSPHVFFYSSLEYVKFILFYWHCVFSGSSFTIHVHICFQYICSREIQQLMFQNDFLYSQEISMLQV